MRDNKSARKMREGTQGKSTAWFSQRERLEGLLLCSLLEQDRFRFPEVSATHAVVVLNHPTKSSRNFKAKKRLTSGQNASILAGTRHNTPWTPRQDDLHPNSNKERVDSILSPLSLSHLYQALFVEQRRHAGLEALAHQALPNPRPCPPKRCRDLAQGSDRANGVADAGQPPLARAGTAGSPG